MRTTKVKTIVKESGLSGSDRLLKRSNLRRNPTNVPYEFFNKNKLLKQMLANAIVEGM